MSNLTRRSFLATGSAALGATALAAGATVPALAEEPQTSLKSWEVVPEPITDIANVEEADVVIIGAGPAGVHTALSAAEAGLSVILIAKSETVSCRGGGSIFAFNSKLAQSLGIEYDLTEVMQVMSNNYMHYNNQAVWADWFKHSGEAIDWMQEHAEKHGVKLVIHECEDINDIPLAGGYKGTHIFVDASDPNSNLVWGAQAKFLEGIVAEGEALGVTYHFNVTAEQLVRGGVPNGTEGRVEAVIAKDADGVYTEYRGTKAVVICTGDYSANEEMMATFHPFTNSKVEGGELASMKPQNGEGHTMALRVGAQWQKNEKHALMIFCNPPMMMGCEKPTYEELGEEPAARNLFESMYVRVMYNRELVVNARGERFQNELTDTGRSSSVVIRQPGCTSFIVIDSKFPEYMSTIGGRVGGDPVTTEQIASYYCYGPGFNSFEEIADAYGFPKETFLATVERYNELARAGFDEDFFKNPDYMHALENPPYYVKQDSPLLLIALGGLECDRHMRVLDAADEPIPGLYAVGTPAGNFYGTGVYPMALQGCNIGRTITAAYLTGAFIAKNE